jgi:periodic tryptophan protein 1
MTSMITAAQWVPRGFAAPFPSKYDFDEAEFDRIAQLAKLQLDDAEEDLKDAEAEKDGKEKAADEDEEMKEDEDKAGQSSEKIECVLPPTLAFPALAC